MTRLTIEPTPLAGLMRVRRKRIGDSRGDLTRIFCADELRSAGWTEPLVQLNLTRTRSRGTVRGLHYQHPPHAETKLVQCLRGEVFDVVVDLRAGSPTFLQWHAERLSPDNEMALLVPAGFAHGFQTLTDDVEMLYGHSAKFAADAEAGLHVEDSTLAIAWPLGIEGLSSRDRQQPVIDASFAGLEGLLASPGGSCAMPASMPP
jgi:dTDP-4-dehydrorhamnose 3,5-epimerase